MDKIQEANQPDFMNAFEEIVKTKSQGINILDDLEMAVKLVKQLKEDLNGLHPSIINIIKALF